MMPTLWPQPAEFLLNIAHKLLSLNDFHVIFAEERLLLFSQITRHAPSWVRILPRLGAGTGDARREQETC